MAGVFNIIPKGGSIITCAFGDNESIPYNIVAADFNEVEREEVLYSGGKLGGNVVNINHGIVEITLLFAVGGTSENDAAVNARTLSSALRNRDGGLIEYRPREYGSTVTNTFYRYLKAGASRRISKKTLIPTETHITGELHEFTVTTFAWATSDPNSFETIVAETRIYNHDDAGHNNYVDILDSSIKGDVFFPVIKVRLDDPSASNRSLIVHKRPMRIGAHTDLDWKECEDIGGLGADVIDAAASNGEYATLGGVTPRSSSIVELTWDSTYLGNISPIMAMRVAPGDDGVWSVEITLSVVQTGVLQTSSFNTDMWGYLTASANSWAVYYQFNELTIPPFSIQQHITNTSTPSVSTYVGNVYWKLEFVRLSGTGDLHIDWILMARADDWLNVFHANIEFGRLDGSGVMYLEVDAISSSVFLKFTSDDSVRTPWENTGSPISDLVFRSGEDSRLRFILPGSFAYPYTPLSEFLVTVTGVHGTIYPFET